MLHYSVYNHETSNEWVTFIHGAGGSSSIWFRQVREYNKYFNVLLIDLRGHGESKNIRNVFNNKYTFDNVTKDVIEVLNHLNIKESHFVGISLGTILIRKIVEIEPQLVKSMVLGGAVMKMNLRGRFLLFFGNTFKSIVPYIWLYKFLAFVIMPKDNHKESRNLFTKEAKKLYQREFKRWFKLVAEVNPLLRLFREKEISTPTLYVMGEEDHMFLPTIKKLAKEHKNATLHVIKNCGHVVNIEKPQVFNQVSVDFITKKSGLNVASTSS